MNSDITFDKLRRFLLDLGLAEKNGQGALLFEHPDQGLLFLFRSRGLRKQRRLQSKEERGPAKRDHTSCPQQLKGMRQSGKTIFVVTHQALLLDGVADEFVWMQEGRIVDRTASASRQGDVL